MEPEENHTLKAFKENVAAVNKTLSIFNSEDYYMIIKKPDIIFNNKVRKLLAEKISNNQDYFVLLDKIGVIFSGELSNIDFIFKVVKRNGENFYKESLKGVATNYFLADILSIPEGYLKVFRLFLTEGPGEKTFQLSFNQYASVVCESILLDSK